MKAIIIGSGIGGLSLGIRLQSKGFEVTILEKSAKVGGHAYQFSQDGFTFDMGPSLITAPDIVRAIFASADKNLEDYLELTKLDPFYRIYFHDKSFLDYNGNTESMVEQLYAFNHKDAQNYEKFIHASEKIYNIVIGEGLGASPFMDISSVLNFIPRAIKLNALSSSYSFAKKFFKDEKSLFTFSFHPLFLGGNPFRAPAVYQMIPYLEKVGGVWYSKGGMYSLIKAFHKVFTEIGGKILTNSQVTNISIKNNKTVGVYYNDSFLKSDIVVSNADFIHTYKDLIDPQFRKKWTDQRLGRIKYSMSAVILYLGLTKKYKKLLHHTLILSKRYRGLIRDIFDHKILPSDFSMYLHAPSKTDSTMAPNGCESLYVLIPVTNLLANVDWEQKAEPFTNQILDYLENKFELDGLSKNIKVKKMFTPNDFKNKTNSYYGSAWGVEPRLTQTAYLRPHNKSEDVEGLYLVGASTHPGAGLPGVMLTAETTENVILNDIPKVKKE